MLRRDFIAAIASFTSASAAVKATIAATKAPDEKAGEYFRSIACGCSDAEAVPPEVADAVAEAAALRSEFEKTVVTCLRDGSLRCLAVEGGPRGYEATLVPHGGVESPLEKGRLTNVIDLYDRGVVYIDRVVVINNYCGVRVFFDICS